MGRPLHELIVNRIRTGGPLTVAEYMELALYHPDHGYYATVPQRSGRAGDFFTSVDVGPAFGRLLARQFEEMWEVMGRPEAIALVEAGAGNGRLSRDVLDACSNQHPDFYRSIRLHLIERAERARRAHREVLGDHAALLAYSGPELPAHAEGIVFANELMDALPVHVVVMTADGLREVHVTEQAGVLREELRPVSTGRIADYLRLVGARLEIGWRAEVGLAADAWVRAAGRQLARGFLLLIDYGHEARELYSPAHSTGTLRAYARHMVDAPPEGYDVQSDRRAQAQEAPAWLQATGERDLTAHVDFTALTRAAESAGFMRLALQDQMYFLLGLGAGDDLAEASGDSVAAIKRRLELKTLLLPGSLGSTHKVLILANGVGRPRLRGASPLTIADTPGARP